MSVPSGNLRLGSRAPLLVLLACGKGGAPTFTYDPSVLTTATTAEQVRANLPDAATLAAASTCVPATGVPTLPVARQIYAACSLGDLASEADYTYATGDRELGARVFVWLRGQNPAEAARIGRLVLGPSAVPADFQGTIPELPGAPAAPIGAPVRVTDRTEPGTWGAFPYWHVEGYQGATSLLADSKSPVASLKYALASAGPPGTAVSLVVVNDQFASLPLHSPTSADAPRAVYQAGSPLVVPSGDVVRVEVDDAVSIGDLVRALGPALGRRIEIAIDHRPCTSGPAGMRCIPGQGKVPTSWIDEVGTVDSAACRAAGACKSPGYTWSSARELCSYSGKRLPTKWEFERANLPLTAPAWTATWTGAGEPPLGLCDDHPACAKSTKKYLSDGTEKGPTLPNKAPVVCASSHPWLTAWPPLQVTAPRPEPPALTPEPDKAAIARSVVGDNLTDKGICGEDVRQNWSEALQKGGRSSTTCRDPFSYVTSNEPLRYLFGRMVRNAGGGYVGVGSDQSYDFITAARSSWAWVFDYDPNVVRLHQVNVPLLRAAATRQEFVELWKPANRDRAHDLIEAAYPPAESGKLVAFYNGYGGRLLNHYSKLLKPMPEDTGFGWLATDANYNHLRTLAEQGRLIPTPLDMLGTTAMRSIGEKARDMGVTIRVYYTSNAPTAWGGEATPDYKKNVLALPFDDQSVVIATTNSGGFQQTGHWHYNVMDGLLFQRRMASPWYTDNKSPMWDRIPGDNGNLTVVGLRAR